MVDFPWPRELVLQALRDRLLSDGAVTEGFTGLDVRPTLPDETPPGDTGHEHVVVVLRWHLDPRAYAIAFALQPEGADEDPTRPPGVNTGLPVTSLEEWVTEVVWSLMEELDTGLVRRATRTQVGEVTFLTTDEAGDDRRPEHHLGQVRSDAAGRFGEHLAEAGLDVAAARRLHQEGRVLTWLHAYRDVEDVPDVGHAVVTRSADEDTGSSSEQARLKILQVIPGTPPTVTAWLAYNAVRDAIDTGATTVTSTLEDRALQHVGFRRDHSGTQSVTWRDIRKPEPRPGSAQRPTA